MAENYEPLDVIGKGTFGTVRKVRHRLTGEILVRKEIEYTSMNAQEKNHIISELRILRELNHPNIVKYVLHDHLPSKRHIHIYQEYCDGGDVGKVISTFRRNNEQVPEEFIWEVFVQTILALNRCHYGVEAEPVDLFNASVCTSLEPKVNRDAVIIHRDIKPDNILLLDGDRTIKLGDFGLAKMLTSQNDFAKTYVGTPYYMSPEVLMDQPYTPVCDIWSLGCVLYELCTLHPPFQAKTHLALQSKIKSGIIAPIEGEYSEQLKEIISWSITVDPAMRPTCHDLLEMLPVKMFRKEMELKRANSKLKIFEDQLIAKSKELEKKEAALLQLVKRSKDIEKKELAILARERDVAFKIQQADANQQASSKQINLQLKQLEEHLKLDFEARKRQMEHELEETRLNYQREFKHVVEQEVQLRIADMMKRTHLDENCLSRQKSASSNSSQDNKGHRPRGPQDFVDESYRPVHDTHLQRRPLYARNESNDSRGSPVRKRITDERNLAPRRHTPGFEEEYRKIHRT